MKLALPWAALGLTCMAPLWATSPALLQAQAQAQAQAQEQAGEGEGEPSSEHAGVKEFTLTIAGGLSLGNYEAGMNWALLEARKQAGTYRLSSVTGASAGAINALLSALLWCAEGPSQIDDNLFQKVWLPVGFPELMPAKVGQQSEGELVLSREISHEQARSIIRAFVDHHTFRAQCPKLKLGFTVTGARPIYRKQGELRAASNYFVVPLAMEVRDGRPVFTADAEFLLERDARGEPKYRHAIGLALPGEPVTLDQVIDTVIASSAFPIAFAPKSLSFAFIDGQACQDSAGSCEMDFSDGGVFDNVPIGLARQLAPGAENIYFSPDIRRLPTAGCKPHAAAESTAPGPIERTLTIFGQALTSARNRVLFETLGQLTTSGDVPVLPSRFAPLTGDLMGEFGAWLDRNFRDYDYLAGVYDGLVFQTVPSSCIRGASQQQQVTNPAALDQVARLAMQLGIQGDNAQALSRFAELERHWGDAARVRQALEGPSAVQQVRRAMFEHHLDRRTGEPRVSGGFCTDEPSVPSLLTRLQAGGYEVDSDEVFAHAAAKQLSHWWRPLGARAVSRLAQAESLLSTVAGVAEATLTYPFDPEESLALKLDLQTKLRQDAEYQLQPGIGYISETGVYTWMVGPTLGIGDAELRLGGFTEALLRPNSEVLGWWLQLGGEYGLRSERARFGGALGVQTFNLLRAGVGLYYWANAPTSARWADTYGTTWEVSGVVALQLDTIYRVLL